ncbi:MAG: DUF2335 domain-containing protein [Gemmatimonadetes bacterium]|nr:DUF2335 domain-containing protein [Gemmatimonadota bacterium]
MRRYEDVHPGLADRIMRLAERQAEHRQALELAVVRGNLDAQSRGAHWAGVLASIALIGGFGLVYQG